MATTLTVRTDITAAQRGLQQLSRDLKGVSSTADAMGKDSDRAVDQLTESLDTAEKQALETAEAVQQVGGDGTKKSVNELANTVADLASRHQSATTASSEAGKASKALDEQNRRTGEATKQLTETLYDLTRGLGSSGVVGGVQAALPKLTGLVNFMAGPWGAALTVGAGLLATLATGLLESAEAEKEATEAAKGRKEVEDQLAASLKERIEETVKLNKGDASAAQSIANALQLQLDIQNQILENDRQRTQEQQDSVESMRRSAEARTKEIRKILDEAGRDKGINLLESERTLAFAPGDERLVKINALIAERESLLAQAGEREGDIAKSLEDQRVEREKIAQIENKLTATKQVAIRKEKEEAAKKHQEELKQIEEKRKAEEAAEKERIEAERQRSQQQLDKDLDRETSDPFADSLRQINETETQRKKFVNSLDITFEEKAQRIEVIEKSANEQRKAVEEAALQSRITADKKAAEERDQKERQKKEQEQQAKAKADEAQKKLTEQQEKQAKAAAERIRKQAAEEDAKPDKSEVQDLAKTLAKQRTAEAEKLAQEELAKRNAERRKNAPDLLSGQAGVNQEIAADERATQERLRRQRAAAERQAMQDIQSGKTTPEEIVAAQQQAIQASLKAAQANGQLSANAVQVMSQATAELANQGQEISALQEQLLLIQRQLGKATSSGQRRRAQAGGGRG